MNARICLWMIAAAWASSLALGDDGFNAPALEQKVDWAAVGVAAVALLGIVVAAFKNAKRTHLD